MAKWLEQASQWHTKCTVMIWRSTQVMSSNPGRVELGILGTSVLSHTWTKISLSNVCEIKYYCEIKLLLLHVLVNIPFEGIRLLDAVCLLLGKRRRALQKTPCAFCSGVVSAWCCLLRQSDVWPVDPLTFSKRTPQGQFRGPPTYSHQVWRRSVKGPQRSRGTNRQTNTARIIVWWWWWLLLLYFNPYSAEFLKIY